MLNQTHFIFNSKFYNQIDGAAIGSPLSPVLDNNFMGIYKLKWLNKYNLNKPKFYLKLDSHFAKRYFLFASIIAL